MEKNYLQLSGLLLFSLLSFIGCQKEITDAPVKDQSEDAAASVNTANRNNLENSCRLVSLDWSSGGAGLWQFHYNEEGLADEWSIDYGYGVISEKMYYDENNRLVRADEVYFGFNYVYELYYTGNRLTRMTRTGVDFPDEIQDFRFTYNQKGQIIRQDDDNLDAHVLMEYDAMGNCTRTDIYFGSDLWYSDNYTFENPVRNPLLNVPGVEIGFLSYGGTYVSNKRWFTTNRTVLYDNGSPIVFNDYDPSKTNPTTGNHNFPVSVNYYDRVSESSLDILFEYENCNGKAGESNRSVPANKNLQARASNPQTRPHLFWGYLKSIKKKVEQ